MSATSAGNTEGDFYPPSAFYFNVVFGDDHTGPDAAFQDVSGIGSEVSLDEVVEGGENGFVHKLPRGVKHTNLELKRGIASGDSPLVQWCKSIFEGGLINPITTKRLNVYLLDAKGNVLRGWVFENAFPVKWDVESFNSTKNEVAIEKISFSYNTSKRVE